MPSHPQVIRGDITESLVFFYVYMLMLCDVAVHPIKFVAY